MYTHIHGLVFLIHTMEKVTYISVYYSLALNSGIRLMMLANDSTTLHGQKYVDIQTVHLNLNDNRQPPLPFSLKAL